MVKHFLLKFIFSIAFVHLFGLSCTAQNNVLTSIPDTADTSNSASFRFSGYLDVFYSYDVSEPSNHQRLPFAYSYNRHNEFNLNLGFAKMEYASQKVRSSLAFMAGTYSNDNLSAEPGVLKNVLEASVGVRLSKTKNLWLDAGVMPSHIGFESAIGKDCWNLTRSMMADNTPYYESGLRVSYTSGNEKWYMSALWLNGWQRISRVDGDNAVSIGHQITYKPNAKLTLNSSSFVGGVYVQNASLTRLYHNFYGIYEYSKRWAYTVGFDIGAQQQKPNNVHYTNWYSPVLIVRFKPSPKTALAARVENFRDQFGVMIPSKFIYGFATTGYSLNFDYKVQSNVLARFEFRTLQSKDRIFIKAGDPSSVNYFITTSLSIAF
jgi:hypothetical protein